MRQDYSAFETFFSWWKDVSPKGSYNALISRIILFFLHFLRRQTIRMNGVGEKRKSSLQEFLLGLNKLQYDIFVSGYIYV